MIEKKDDINKQIHSFIKYAIEDDIPVFNSRYILTSKTSNRIEFYVGSFISTGRIHTIEEETTDQLVYGSRSDYRCQLVVRIVGDPEFCSKYSSRIGGAIQSFGIVEMFVKDFEIQNESMRIRDIPYRKSGLISSIPEIAVNCVVSLSYKRDIDYFDKVQNVQITIK